MGHIMGDKFPDCYPDEFPHSHGYGPIQEFPVADGCCPPPPKCGPENHCPPPPPPPPVPGCSPVPPPIPPVQYIPGMDVQEQLNNMANRVNTAINRWNHIQANCYRALDEMVGAAVSNDVYYEPCEVHYTEGYSACDGAKYELIEACPVDKAGRPIIMRLVTAYDAGNYAARQPMSDASFVTSANAIITARMTAWSGLCLKCGNPVTTQAAIPDSWYAGWNDRGKLIILPEQMATVEEACRRHIMDLIGPVIPIIENGEITAIANEFAPDTPAAIQAIGYKKCNGVKVMFSCGYQDNAGCTVKNVADLLKDMGVTTAVITCRQTAYGQPDIGGFAEKPSETTVSYADTTGDDVLGLTGGMMYIGNIADRPLNYQMPQNAAFWVISKRPPCGWNNRFTGEIADICQRLGSNANELASVQGKLDIEQKQILTLQNRVGKLEENDAKQDETLADHTTRISGLEKRMDTAEGNIVTLVTAVNNEIKARETADEQIRTILNQEITERKDEDNRVRNDVNQIRTALTEEITSRNQADQDLINSLNNEMNARMAADQNLRNSIDAVNNNQTAALNAEKIARENADADLQMQIDNLSKNFRYVSGPGIGFVPKPGNVTEIGTKIGGGIRYDSLSRLAVDTGPGIGVVNGKVIPILSDDFFINEKGEIEMNCNCCSEQTEAGTGLSYKINPQTGAKSMNLDPPKDGEIGGVKAGANVTIDPDGTINAAGGEGTPYTLPPATDTTLGGVIVGENLTVDASGKVSASAPYVLPQASASVLGGVKVGANLTIDENGVLNAVGAEGQTGEIVTAGYGMDVDKTTPGTAKVGLNSTVQATLAQVGDNKSAIDAAVVDLGQKVDKTAYNTDKQNLDTRLATIAGDASSAQAQAAQANANVAEAVTKANTAQSDATAAYDLAIDVQEQLPEIATATKPGLVKPGENVTVTADGTMNVTVPAGGVNVQGGTGIDVTLDSTGSTATVALNTNTQNTLASVAGAVSTANEAKVAANDAMGEAANALAEAEEAKAAIPGVATAEKAGIVKPGEGISITADGTISASDGGLPTTGGTMTGPIKMDGTYITGADTTGYDAKISFSDKEVIMSGKDNVFPRELVLSYENGTDPTTNPGKVKFRIDENYSGAISADNAVRVNGIADPRSEFSAVNKRYVDGTEYRATGTDQTVFTMADINGIDLLNVNFRIVTMGNQSRTFGFFRLSFNNPATVPEVNTQTVIATTTISNETAGFIVDDGAVTGVIGLFSWHGQSITMTLFTKPTSIMYFVF